MGVGDMVGLGQSQGGGVGESGVGRDFWGWRGGWRGGGFLWRGKELGVAAWGGVLTLLTFRLKQHQYCSASSAAAASSSAHC